MANKQYVFSGTGSPIANAVTPEVLTSHYVDKDSGDIWLWEAEAWVLIYVGASSGNIAFYKASDLVPVEPSHAAIKIMNDGSAELWDGASWRQLLGSNT